MALSQGAKAICRTESHKICEGQGPGGVGAGHQRTGLPAAGERVGVGVARCAAAGMRVVHGWAHGYAARWGNNAIMLLEKVIVL